MALNITLLVTLMNVGAIASVFAAIYGWRRHEINGNRLYSIALLMMGWWAMAYSAELIVTDPASKLLWARLQYLSLPLTPIVLVFVSLTAGYKWQNSLRNVAPLFFIPFVTNFILWFRQPLIWSAIDEISVGGTMQLQFSYGPWFLVSLGSIYLLYAIAAVIIIRLVFASPRLTRIEAGMLLFGATFPFLVNILYIFKFEFLRGLDLTPLSLATFGLITAWVVFEIRPINLLPVVYDAAFESLPDPAMTVDAYNRIRLLNPAGVSQMILSGRDPEQVRGNSMRHVMPEHWFELVEQANEHETVTHEVERHTNGFVEYFDMRVTPLRDRGDRFKGRLFVIRDITRRKNEQLALAQREQVLAQAVEEKTAELRLSNENLMNAVRMKDEFLAGMSHELRTPLNAIIGTSESIDERIYGHVPVALHEPLKRIDQSASHLLELINDILDVSKIEAGNLELYLAPVQLEEVCQGCIKLIEPEAAKKGIEVLFSAELKRPIIEADPRRLRQILLNLLSNAIKFTPENGRVGLDICDSTDHCETRFAVWDTGIGIDGADLERIFDPFVQVDSSLARRYDGTGLGLALTRSLVQMHNGDIAVQSQPGAGSRFITTLPW